MYISNAQTNTLRHIHTRTNTFTHTHTHTHTHTQTHTRHKHRRLVLLSHSRLRVSQQLPILMAAVIRQDCKQKHCRVTRDGTFRLKHNN